ncbi:MULTISPECIES: hypothetical protein [unclassified Adlercreutzia]|uniref:hypothetical protein n=1 Tax=unclassified Adlercreutzia TaxID=2636013 RepID=UPI0013EC16FA|nr:MULTISPECIES: hypothetical protein [unclassified Adlercreutzia]
MEKNVSLRTASGLFILVLLTTCIIGATFAKYTTSDDATDTARVAKWGVMVTLSGDGAFAEAYSTDGAVNDDNNNAISNSVVSNEKVVAPGTSGTLVNAIISGAPEVAVKVKTEATLNLTDWTANGNEYCPIVITIDGDQYKMGASKGTTEVNGKHIYTYYTIADFITGVETALEKEENVAPGVNLADEYDHAVGWVWDFNGETTDGAYRTDEKDTALGDLNSAPAIGFTYTATVTQID